MTYAQKRTFAWSTLILYLAVTLLFCITATAAWAGRNRPVNAHFPAGPCNPNDQKLDADEFLLIRYVYRANTREQYDLVNPGACVHVPPERFDTLKAECVVYRRERFQPDEPLRVSDRVEPIRVTELPAECVR